MKQRYLKEKRTATRILEFIHRWSPSYFLTGVKYPFTEVKHWRTSSSATISLYKESLILLGLFGKKARPLRLKMSAALEISWLWIKYVRFTLWGKKPQKALEDQKLKHRNDGGKKNQWLSSAQQCVFGSLKVTEVRSLTLPSYWLPHKQKPSTFKFFVISKPKAVTATEKPAVKVCISARYQEDSPSSTWEKAQWVLKEMKGRYAMKNKRHDTNRVELSKSLLIWTLSVTKPHGTAESPPQANMFA